MVTAKVAERRKSPRVKGDFTIQIAHQKTKIIAHTINISTTGIYCQGDRPIPLFREIEIEIHLPLAPKSIKCSGVIVRSEKIPGKERYNLAIFFVGLSPKNKELLLQYVEEKMDKVAV